MLFLYLSMVDDEKEKSKFKDLYYKYDKMMMNIAMEKLHDINLAEEALQDAWMYIATHFDNVGEVYSNRTRNYLATITTGYAINKYNKENKIHKLYYVDDIDMVSDSYFDQYDALEIKLAMDALDDECKNILYLTYIYGYKSNEIAKMFDCTDSNIRKKLQVAKCKLKNRLGGANDE
ncbi:MAG: RNA polymerase sigma factor [Eubacterium sp.]